MNKAIIEPKEMPKFLNEVAEKFKDEEGQETMLKLAQCSVYIHGVNQLAIQNNQNRKEDLE